MADEPIRPAVERIAAIGTSTKRSTFRTYSPRW